MRAVSHPPRMTGRPAGACTGVGVRRASPDSPPVGLLPAAARP